MTLEELQAFCDRGLPALLGLRFTGLGQGRVTSELDVGPEHLAPNGYLHAATLVALADTACGAGTRASLEGTGEGFTTVELKSNFLGTATEGTIVCEATARHLGGTTQVWDAEVVEVASGRRLALFRCTQMILRPRASRTLAKPGLR